MLKAISAAEKEFICEGCMSNVRSDGRTVDSFRSISIENNVMPHVHGSAKVQLGVSMSVVCSVKLSVVDVVLENKPLLDISTSISPSNLYRNDDRLPNFEGIISERMFNIIGKSNTIDFEKLCIIPNRFQWIVAIELVVLNMNEDPTDLCSIAINTALKCTMVPNHTLIRGESGEYEDFEINSFPSEAYLLPILKPIPICVSIHKIGTTLVLDCDSEEEASASSGVIVAVDSLNNICGIQKILSGSITGTDMSIALQYTLTVASSIFHAIDDVMKLTATRDKMHPDAPFQRMGLLI